MCSGRAGRQSACLLHSFSPERFAHCSVLLVRQRTDRALGWLSSSCAMAQTPPTATTDSNFAITSVEASPRRSSALSPAGLSSGSMQLTATRVAGRLVTNSYSGRGPLFVLEIRG